MFFSLQSFLVSAKKNTYANEEDSYMRFGFFKSIFPLVFSFFLFFLPLVYSFSTNQVFEVNKFTVLLFFAGIFSLLFAFSSTLSLSRKELFWIFGFFGMLGVSVFFSTTPIVSLLGSAGRHMGFISLLAMLVIFLISKTLSSDKKNIDLMQGAIIASGTVVAGYAIFQYLHFPLPDPLFGSLDARSMSYRAFAFLGQPNFVAQVLIIPFLLGIHFFLTRKRYFLLILFSLVFITAFWTTDSRAGMLAAVIGILLYFSSRNPTNIIKTFVLLIPLSLWLFVFFGGMFFSFSERGSSLLARYYFWNDAVSLWISSFKTFFWGVGPDTLSSAWASHLSYGAFASEYFLMLPDRVHTIWLDLLMQWGLVPSLFIFLFFAFLLKKSSHEPILFSCLWAMLIAWSFGFFIITDLVFFVVIAGMLLKKQKEITFFANPWKWFRIVFFIPLSLLFFWTAWSTWTADKAFLERDVHTMMRAPFLESNLVAVYDALPSEKQTMFVETLLPLHFASRGWKRMLFLEALKTKNLQTIQSTFDDWRKSAGNNPLEQLRVLSTAKTFGVLSEDQYNQQATIIKSKFPKKSDVSFGAQKIWKSIGAELETY